jgi:plasmid stabilization system protein ParE
MPLVRDAIEDAEEAGSALEGRVHVLLQGPGVGTHDCLETARRELTNGIAYVPAHSGMPRLDVLHTDSVQRSGNRELDV